MKKYVIALFAFAVSTTMLTGCLGSIFDYGQTETRTIALPGAYTKLEISHAFDVEISDAVTAPTFTMPEQLFDKLIFGVGNETLEIGLKGAIIGNVKALTVQLPMNAELTSIKASGASDMIAHNLSKIEKIRLSGASKLRISGQTEKLDIDLSGASDLDARDLLADCVKGSLSGASDADITVCSELKVRLSDASDLTYGFITPTCNPEISCPCSGASSVTPRH